MELDKLIWELSQDPFNPEKNFQVALEYERLSQTASAISFFLRTAEYSKEDNSVIVYVSLLKMAHCLADQVDREHSVVHALLQAVTVCPRRPEAFFLLAQQEEWKGHWQEAYTWASLGKNSLETHGYEPLKYDVKYPGDYGIKYELAISSWWIGRQIESIQLLEELEGMDLAPQYKESVENNLKLVRG